MQGWIDGFQASIDYIEKNLTETLDVEVIERKHLYLRSIIREFSVRCVE